MKTWRARKASPHPLGPIGTKQFPNIFCQLCILVREAEFLLNDNACIFLTLIAFLNMTPSRLGIPTMRSVSGRLRHLRAPKFVWSLSVNLVYSALEETGSAPKTMSTCLMKTTKLKLQREGSFFNQTILTILPSWH